MVGQRLVYLKAGKAYVPMSEQVNIVMNEYQEYLLKSLEATSKLLPRMEEDDRLKPILMNVETQYIGNTYNNTMDPNYTGSVGANEVDPVNSFSFVQLKRLLIVILRLFEDTRHYVCVI